MKYHETPKGELVRDDQLTDVELPPQPDNGQLWAKGFHYKGEAYPRVPAVGDEMWADPIHPNLIRDCEPVPDAFLYHGLRWIIENLAREVELPPKPDAEELRAKGYRLKEVHPRVPVEGVDAWVWVGLDGSLCIYGPGSSHSSLYHGLRWIVEEIPAQIETPPEGLPEDYYHKYEVTHAVGTIGKVLPDMPDAPEGFFFLRARETQGALSVLTPKGFHYNCLSFVADDPNYAGLYDAKGRYMAGDPMWDGDGSDDLWQGYYKGRTLVRPAFVMFRKDGGE